MFSFGFVLESFSDIEGKEKIPLEKVALGAPAVVSYPPSVVFAW